MRKERELLEQSLDEMYNHLKQLQQEIKRLITKHNEYYTTQYLPLEHNRPEMRSLDPLFHCEKECIAHNVRCEEALDQWAANMTRHQMMLAQMDDEIKRLKIMYKDFNRSYDALQAAYAQHHTALNVGNSSPALFSLPSRDEPHTTPSSPTNSQ